MNTMKPSAGTQTARLAAKNVSDNATYGSTRIAINESLPALVRGVEADGSRFSQEGVIDIFSSSSFSLRLSRRLNEGRRIFVVILVDEVLVALRGIVGDTRATPDETYISAIAIAHFRFLPVLHDGTSPDWLRKMLDTYKA